MRKGEFLIVAAGAWFAMGGMPLAAQSWVAGQPGTVQVGINAATPGQSTVILPWPTATPPVPSSPVVPAYHGPAHVGALTPPLMSPVRTYPPCTAQLRDGCINPLPPRR